MGKTLAHYLSSVEVIPQNLGDTQSNHSMLSKGINLMSLWAPM